MIKILKSCRSIWVPIHGGVPELQCASYTKKEAFRELKRINPQATEIELLNYYSIEKFTLTDR